MLLLLPMLLIPRRRRCSSPLPISSNSKNPTALKPARRMEELGPNASVRVAEDYLRAGCKHPRKGFTVVGKSVIATCA